MIKWYRTVRRQTTERSRRGVAPLGWCLRALLPCISALLVLTAGWADYRQESGAAPGMKYVKMVKSAGPLEIDALAVDLATPGVKVECPHAGESVLQVQRLSGQIRQVNELDHYATGGINGDFFFLSPKAYAGKPIGLQVHKGEILSSPWRAGRSCFAILRDGRAVIDIPSMNAWATRQDGTTFSIGEVNSPRGPDSLVLYTPAYGATTQSGSDGVEVTLTDMNLPLEPGKEMQGIVRGVSGAGGASIPFDGVVLSAEGSAVSELESLRVGEDISFVVQLSAPFDQALEAIGGGPRLLRDGRISVEGGREGFESTFVSNRHPRSAVGFDGSRLYLLTIDGRQKGYSAGASLEETAQILRSLGAKEGMNLDGGGSTTLIARDEILNSPSDGTERAIANGLLTICTIPKGPPETLSLDPPSLHIASGSSVHFDVEGKDRLGNIVSAGRIKWVLNPASLGSISADGWFIAGESSGSGLVKAFREESDAYAYAEVTVEEALASIALQPSAALLFPGESLRLGLVGRSEKGEEVRVNPLQANWSIENGAGQVDWVGNFVSGSPGVTKVVTLFKGLRAEATLYVGGSVVEVEDFENTAEWSRGSYPTEVPSSFQKSVARAYAGSYSGRLLYDFTTLDVTRAAYATCDLDIGTPRALSVWVWGDGRGHWLRGTLEDAGGQRLVVDFARRVDWKDEWREVCALIPQSGFQFPLRLKSIYLAEPNGEQRDEGAIYFDDLRALY